MKINRICVALSIVVWLTAIGSSPLLAQQPVTTPGVAAPATGKGAPAQLQAPTPTSSGALPVAVATPAAPTSWRRVDGVASDPAGPSSFHAATANSPPPSDWPQYSNPLAGYTLFHPPDLTPQERANRTQAAQSGVVSNLWLGESINLVARIPRLDKATFDRWTVGWTPTPLGSDVSALRFETVLTSPYSDEQRRSVQYAVRTDAADYLLTFNAPMADTGALDRFGRIVQTFTPTGAPTYQPPTISVAAAADGFDFPVDPRDGSSGRAPWYASYNAQNPYLDWWSSCYSKNMSQLQHAGEDWFRSAGSPVYAVANGRVIWAQDANYPGAVVIVEHELPAGVSSPWGNDRIYSMVGHLSTSGLVAQWTDVQKGQQIGVVYDWNSNSHVHWEMRRYGNMQQAPAEVNGFRYCNTSWPGPGYTDTGASPDWFGYTNPSNWVDGHRSSAPPPPPPSCPQSGGVLLYQHSNYDCGGAGENEGYVLRDGAGFQNMPGSFNDKASSIRIPDGWSVKLYEHSERGGGSRCINATGDDNFGGDTFDNGVSLNDAASSFEVFSTADCSSGATNRAPNTPQPASPSDWYVARDGRAPTLCWQNNGDPDGDAVQFFAEVFESAANAQSGWISDTCWRPGELDGRYFNFQWRVKARDSRAAESGWSSVWHFTIEQAPAPPTANWRAEYWNNKNLSGSPSQQRDEGGVYLFRDWGDGAPMDGVQTNEWSARFTKTIYFPGGDYRFHCQHDDGCRIYIDGQLKLDAWWDSGFEGHDWGGNLGAGNHEIKIEFFDNLGGARLDAWWQGPGFLPREQSCDANAWCGEYWGNRGLSGTPPMRRNEGAVLSFNWGDGGPDSTFPADGFSTRFQRSADFTCGLYRFFVDTDDGVRFWIDDVLRLDEWRDQAASFTTDVNLTSGSHALKVEHYENGGGAGIGVRWEKLSDCAANTVVEHASTHYVKPGREIAPAVRVRVSEGSLDGERSDHLAHVGGETLGAATTQPIVGRVDTGQSYTFDVANSASFAMTAPAAAGVYESRWRVHSNGALIGETATVRVVVDDTPSTLAIVAPVDGALLTDNRVIVRAEPNDDGSGIDQVQFFVGYDDGGGWDWRNLGWDIDGSDGWNRPWDASGVLDQRGIAFHAYAWDRADNSSGASAWGITLDRAAPDLAFAVLPASQAANVVTVRWLTDDPVAGVGRIDVQVRRDEGEWVDWLVGLPAHQVGATFIDALGHRYGFRAAVVDRAGNVRAYPGSAEVETTIDACSPDTYEPDGSAAAAQTLQPGASQLHTFCDVGDEDWVAIWMDAGRLYTMETTDLATSTDTVLTLYAGDGVTQLAENDDIDLAVNLASLIAWRAEVTGRHYVRVRHWNRQVAGDAVRYRLQVSASPVADFTAGPVSGVAPLSVHFTDASTGTITSRSWNFGDGGTSTAQNPSYSYAVAGVYTVTLTVTGPGGVDDAAQTVSVAPPLPIFTDEPAPSDGLTVHFAFNPPFGVTHWLWEFGDGETSTAQNPVHTYAAPGNYVVRLSVFGPNGTSSSQERLVSARIDATPPSYHLYLPNVGR